MKHIELILLSLALGVSCILLNLNILTYQSKIRDLEKEVEKLEEQNSKCYYLSDTIAEVYNIE